MKIGAGVTGGLKTGIIAFGESKSRVVRKPPSEGFTPPLTKLELVTGGSKLEERLPGDSKMGTKVTGGLVGGGGVVFGGVSNGEGVLRSSFINGSVTGGWKVENCELGGRVLGGSEPRIMELWRVMSSGPEF